MRQSIRLGTISGIPVGINWGLLLVAAFYIFNLAAGILPASVPGQTSTAYWAFAAVSVVLFFGSILAHELGHSIVAQRNGINVRAITLWLLGGVAELEKEANDPGVEFRIAIAGPAVSVALAVLFGGAAVVSSILFSSGLLSFTFGYLALANGVLAAFNLLPAAPLDGGRVLAAALWRKNKNRHVSRATAAKAGQVFGSVLLAVGVFGILSGGGTFVLAILGFFLLSAAGAERRRAETLNAFTKTDVASAMQPLVAPVSGGITVAGLEAMSTGLERPIAYPVWGPGGATGIVSSAAVNDTPVFQRVSTLVGDITVGWDRFVSANLNEEMSEVLRRSQAEGKPHVIVYDRDSRQVGYLSFESNLIPLRDQMSSTQVRGA